MEKVVKLTQTQFACPSKFTALLESGEEIEFRHRLSYPFDDNEWRVWQHKPEDPVLMEFITDSDDLWSILHFFGQVYDFSTAEIVKMPDPNEGYDILGGLPHEF